MESKKNDLKSDKVRSIIGSIPSRILRQGNAVISLLILCMIFLAHILPYYDYQYLDVSIQCIPQIRLLYAPYDGVYINVEKDSLCEGDIYGFILTTDNRLVKLATPSCGVLHESIIDNTHVKSKQVIGLIVPSEIKQIIAIAYVDASRISTFKINQSASLQFNSIEGEKEIQSKISEIKYVKNGKCAILFQIQTNLYDNSFIDSISYEGKAKILISNIPITKKILGI